MEKKQTFEEFLEREGYDEGSFSQEIWADGARRGAEWQRQQQESEQIETKQIKHELLMNSFRESPLDLMLKYYNDIEKLTEVKMKANEMRIGNWYDENGATKQVNPNTIEAVWVAERIWCKPIPLTEEWLLKFGFKYDTDNDKLCKSLHIDILSFRTSEGHICLESQGYRTLYKHIKYVHQLQNLYFALTGEELEIKN